jgi:release factor glutamine methyltransferase
MPDTAAAMLAAAVARLAAAGIETPRTDARLLLAHALGLQPDRLVTELPAVLPVPLAAATAARLDAAVAARAARQPLSQIVGGRLFWGRWFGVTPDVLDPRPETEVLVAAALAAPFARVLDLGTGSGAILISLLADRPEATGMGLDLSEAALAVARGNAAALGVADRAAFALSDWYRAAQGRYDLIVANPPYLDAAEIALLAPEVRVWEPRMALTPGPDGLAALRAVLADAPPHLSPGGRLFCEIGPTQGTEVVAMAAAAGLADPQLLRDLDGRDRVLAARARA